MESLSSCARCSGRRAEGGGWMGGWWGDGSGWGERRTAGEGHGQAVGPRHGVGGGQRAVEGAAGRDQAVAASTRRVWTCGRWVGRVRGGAGPSSPVRPPLSACGQAPLPSGSGHPLPKAGSPPRAPGVLDLGPLRTRLLKGPSACLQKGRASWAACVHCGPPRGCVQGHSASRGASPRGQVFSHSHLAEWDISRGQQAETATWSMAGR